ncbi:MAG: nucleotide exchange factor GrpE [Myxococcota bacterium]|jgi:molecular chaperone GrpE|nr:nucleotide exchange factor GrpE [Myxococcota bacterium]
MASKDTSTDDVIPVILIDETEMVDLASLLEDDSAANEEMSKLSKPPGAGAAHKASAAGLSDAALLEATAALVASVDDTATEEVPAPPPVLNVEEPETAASTAGNVFNVSLDGLDDFEALLQRTMGEAVGVDADPAEEAVPTVTIEATGPNVSVQLGDETRTRDRTKRTMAQTTKWRRPEPAKSKAAAGDEPSRESKAVEELRKKVKEMTAETESYRARLKEEAEAARGKGREDVFKALLPILDTLELALKSANESQDTEQLTQGIELVIKKLTTDLEQLGLEPVDPAGKPFDPNLHEAFQQVTTGKVDVGMVAEVVRKGYRFEERLLRPAQVLVEKA